jgi:hypothetical protein
MFSDELEKNNSSEMIGAKNDWHLKTIGQVVLNIQSNF